MNFENRFPARTPLHRIFTLSANCIVSFLSTNHVRSDRGQDVRNVSAEAPSVSGNNRDKILMAESYIVVERH